jgi:hypothetical protein
MNQGLYKLVNTGNAFLALLFSESCCVGREQFCMTQSLLFWPVGGTRRVGRTLNTTEAEMVSLWLVSSALGRSEDYNYPEMIALDHRPPLFTSGDCEHCCSFGQQWTLQWILATCPLCAGNLPQAQSPLRALYTWPHYFSTDSRQRLWVTAWEELWSLKFSLSLISTGESWLPWIA